MALDVDVDAGGSVARVGVGVFQQGVVHNVVRDCRGALVPVSQCGACHCHDLYHPHLLRGWALCDVPDVLYQRDVQHNVFLRR